MTGRPPRSLPGVRFAATPPPEGALPRMDVALFAGFAAEGPVDVPVALESERDFEAVFGGDVTLAFDAARGEALRAGLGPSVRAFFANGGRRCWALRVAGAAVANRFPLPGLLRASGGALSPALARSRSRGSASDGLRASAALASRPLATAPLTKGFSAPPAVSLPSPARGEVRAGDLLRLTFSGPRLVWLFAVDSVVETGALVRALGGDSFWFRSGAPEAPAGALADAFDGERVAASLPVEGIRPASGDEITLVLATPLATAPSAGAFVRVDLGAEELWVRVRDTRLERAGGPSAELSAVRGPGLRRLKAGLSAAQADALVGEPVSAERLSFDLWARRGEGPVRRLEGLSFAQAHPRFWGALPADEELYRARLGGAEAAPDEQRAALWAEAAAPRFPLAGARKPRHGGPDAASIYLPLGMAFAPDAWLGPLRRHPGQLRSLPLVRDGLARLRKGLFLDPALADMPSTTLLAEADFLRYQSPAPRALRGLHAALAVEEATLIAAPDAAHRHWQVPSPAPPDEPAPQEPPPPAHEPGAFHDCRLPLEAPAFVRPVSADATGSFTLRWAGALDAGSGHVPGERYVVEESPGPTFDLSTAIYAGVDPSLSIWGRPSGDFHYRVRIENAAGPGPWSLPLTVRVGAAPGAALEAAADYLPGDLLDVQQALLRLCAARGDVLAVLAMPEHYREAEAVAHAAALAGRLGLGEATALNYGALYHPWLSAGAGPAGALRSPPEGAVVGVLARRAIARGAWAAPANEPLAGVVSLTPAIGEGARQALQDAQVNLIRNEPAGFITLSADTLSADADLVPVHVRRLLILLRRAALRLGAAYAFEPNDGALRRLVQRSFEEMLSRMYALGAFAGASESAAFRVVPDAVPAGGPAEGRFSVDLRVAPAAPMAFLTVRLVQSGDASRVTEVR